jgi:hypothetical protein
MVGFFPRTLIGVGDASAQPGYRHGSTRPEVAHRDLQALPVVTKAMLMERFDEWVTAHPAAAALRDLGQSQPRRFDFIGVSPSILRRPSPRRGRYRTLAHDALTCLAEQLRDDTRPVLRQRRA